MYVTLVVLGPSIHTMFQKVICSHVISEASLKIKQQRKSLSTSATVEVDEENNSREKMYQALSHFSVLQATESWAGPENEANSVSDIQ